MFVFLVLLWSCSASRVLVLQSDATQKPCVGLCREAQNIGLAACECPFLKASYSFPLQTFSSGIITINISYIFEIMVLITTGIC